MEQFHTCENPRLIYNKYIKRHIQVNCGHCSACECRKFLRNVPALMREAFSWRYCIFFTLTYSDEFLPRVDVSSYRDNIKPQFLENYDYLVKISSDYISLQNGLLPVVRYADVQKFIKRLRKKISTEFSDCVPQLRYAISGDYGSTLFRPHYHGLLFFSSKRLAENISSYISYAWSVKSEYGRYSIGRVDVQRAFGAAKYVSTYINTDSERPLIYQFRDFRPKLLHSSSPSLGSLVRPTEKIDEIVTNGLTKVHIYDPVKFSLSYVPVVGSLKYRLFPSIPSFNRIGRVSRMELYRLVQSVRSKSFTRQERLGYFKRLLKINSFFKDYIYDGKNYLDDLQLCRKLDSFYYTCSRFLLQADSLGYSVSDYDSFVYKFNFNKKNESLSFYFDIQNKLILRNGHFDPSYFDISKLSDNDSIDKHFVSSDFVYFSRSLSQRNKIVKRKCDNAYLESHPEYKKFHS